MKKIISFSLLIIISLSLIACNEKDTIVLPDLTGMNEQEIRETLNQLEATYEIAYVDDIQGFRDGIVTYSPHNQGDTIEKSDAVVVTIHKLPDNVILLPNLEGFSMEEITLYFEEFNISINFLYQGVPTVDNQQTFKAYGSFLQPGDVFDVGGTVAVIIYPLVENTEDIYFQPMEMIYDGPLLDSSFETIDPIDPRGGYFDVTLKYCTDGDTAVFNYPDEIYNAITSGAKSTRFLNMDTEETFSGGEEEWGKPASVYTCDLLSSAEAIILQTDPGDNLLGNYGRLLAWVWIKLPGEQEYFLLNYMVVKQGLAQVKYEFGAGETISFGDYTYNEWMHIAENYAIENDLGQWGELLDYYWNYETDQPYYSRWN